MCFYACVYLYECVSVYVYPFKQSPGLSTESLGKVQPQQ